MRHDHNEVYATLREMNENIETYEEKIDKRCKRTKDIISENIEKLYDVGFDLDYFQDYTGDENLKEASELINKSLELMKKFVSSVK
ncbi:TPA: hypothetical protein NNW70_004188 [Salmonella enterica]|nr:hypothetical protein [Salmonella enterica]HCH9607898.1 hypothetical protein [Salmonella enterica]HDI5000192.1 hypothetical protein [Salmonella enterica]